MSPRTAPIAIFGRRPKQQLPQPPYTTDQEAMVWAARRCGGETMRLAIIGAPIDFGASRRGVDMGCSAIRYAGLQGGLERIGHDVVDLGNADVTLAELGKTVDPR